MIEVRNLSKHFGPFEAVRDISFSVEQGEIVGLLGPNGAGKTTTMRMMTGYYEPSSGEVNIGGASVHTDLQALQRKIGYLPESASSYADMIVADFLRFVARARGVAEENLQRALDYAIDATSLHEYYYRPIAHLSKGFRQRLGLAATLLHDPSVLILDEPTSGLDPNQILEMQDFIKKLAQEKTIILSTHILQEVEATCQRAIIISQGEIALDKPLESLTNLKEGMTSVRVQLKGQPEQFEPKLKQAFSAEGEEVERAQGSPDAAAFVITTGKAGAERIFQLAVEQGWTITELAAQRRSLEQIFQSLTIQAGEAA